jgi:hypothetical protein
MLVTALGMLVVPVEFTRAVPDGQRADDVAVRVLATVLADVGAAADRIRVVHRQLRGGARRITDAALLRLGAGVGHAVVDR